MLGGQTGGRHSDSEACMRRKSYGRLSSNWTGIKSKLKAIEVRRSSPEAKAGWIMQFQLTTLGYHTRHGTVLTRDVRGGRVAAAATTLKRSLNTGPYHSPSFRIPAAVIPQREAYDQVVSFQCSKVLARARERRVLSVIGRGGREGLGWYVKAEQNPEARRRPRAECRRGAAHGGSR